MTRSGAVGVRSLADGVGIAGSALCALHCLVAPVLLVAGTTLPATFAAESFHHALLWSILPASIVAFGLGCRQHKDWGVLGLGAVGLAGLLVPMLAHGAIGDFGERAITVASAGCLIAAHIRNFKRCRVVQCDHAPSAG